MINVVTWINLEITVNKKASHKGPHSVPSHLYETFRTGKSLQTENEWVVGYLEWGELKQNGDWLLMGTEFFLGVMKIN